MQNPHTVTMSQTRYPGSLRIFECETCDYAFAAEVGAHNIIQYETKETINHGDLNARHSVFQIPHEPLKLTMSAASEALAEDDFGG